MAPNSATGRGNGRHRTGALSDNTSLAWQLVSADFHNQAHLANKVLTPGCWGSSRAVITTV